MRLTTGRPAPAEMKKFEKVLEDSYTTQFLEHPLNELEGFIRIW